MDASDRVLFFPPDDPGRAPMDPRRAMAALRAGAVPILVGAFCVAVVVLLVSLAAPKRYQATAHIVATPAASTTGIPADPRGLATGLALIDTPAVHAAAAQRVPGETSASVAASTSATVRPDADVIDVTATDDSAAGAAAIANAVAQAFLDERTAIARAAIARNQASLNAQLAAVAANPAAVEQASTMRRRLGALAVADANAGNDLQLADPAVRPSSASSPRPAGNALLAFFVALVVAALAVLARERMHPAGGTARRVAGLPLITRLPSGEVADDRRGLPRLVRRLPRALSDVLEPVVERRARRRGASATSRDEALHSLLGAVLLAVPPGYGRVVVVTSPGREGSTLAAAGLARALAQAGQRTLALPMDLGAASLGEALGVPPAPAHDPQPSHDDGQALPPPRRVPGLDALDVVAGGRANGDRVGLLRPGAAEKLFAALERSPYAYVVVDAPSLLSAPEARVVARHADAIVLACPERTPEGDLADTREILETIGVPVLGAVIAAPWPVREPAGGDGATAAPSAGLMGLPPGVPGGAPASPPNGEVPELVLERLRAADQPLTFSQLCATLDEVPTAVVRDQLRRLCLAGDVLRAGTGRREDPFRYSAR